MHKKGLSRFSFEIFLCHSTKKFAGEPLCFRKLLVSKFSSIRGGGGFTIFGRMFFFLTAPKNFVGEPLLVSDRFWYRKFSCIRGGITIFRRINKVKKCRQRLGFEPAPSPSERCCPTHCAMGTIGISDKGQ